MKKIKGITMVLFIILLLFLIPNISKATVDVTREIFSNNGSMKFKFTGLTLDEDSLYEFGIGKLSASEITKWFDITEYTESSATINLNVENSDMRSVMNAVDTGYVTIRNKTDQSLVMEKQSIDLKIPFLKLTNRIVIPNGTEYTTLQIDSITIPMRTPSNANVYYQYEKIMDANVIKKYKEIKKQNGNIYELQDILKKQNPTSNWIEWSYFNGYGQVTGYGYPQKPIKVPSEGLYYLWIYSSGDNLKDMYGYILVDNLEEEIALESLTIPKTATVNIGGSITLTPVFNPSGATNRIVTWSSSDESVATVDNAGKITPKKVGSTIITVTSEDGSKKATCTVTVTDALNNNNNENNNNNPGSSNNNSGNNGATTNNNGGSTKKDGTTLSGVLPQTGMNIGLGIGVLAIFIGAIVFYRKYRKYNV